MGGTVNKVTVKFWKKVNFPGEQQNSKVEILSPNP